VKSGWEEVTIGDVCTKPQYGWTTKARPDSGEIRLLRTTDITPGNIDWTSVPFCTETPADLQKYLVREDDIVISRAGSVGVSHLVTKVEPAVFASYLIRFRPGPRVRPRYLAYFLKSPAYWKQIADNTSGIAIPNVNASKLQEVRLPLAPLEQQEQIVAEIEKQFSRLDEAVAGLQRVKANLKRYKAAVLKAAVEGRLVPTEADLARREGRSYETGAQLLQRILETRRSQWQGKGKYKEPTAPDTTDLPELPEGWVWASIEQLADVVRGGSPRPAGDPRYFGGPVPWITVGPITADESDYLHRVPEGLTLEGKERSRFIESETLLLTNSGATLGVPKISLIGGCINDGVAALLDVEYPLKRYLLNFLRTKTMSLRQINQGAAQPNLNTSIIKAMVVPMPPSEEQHRVVAEVDRLLSIAREAEAEGDANLKRAQALRQAILSKAFSGSLQ
jgi:type I restriction enzyme, S subunit